MNLMIYGVMAGLLIAVVLLGIWCYVLQVRTLELATALRNAILSIQECLDEIVKNDNKMGEAINKNSSAINYIIGEISDGKL